MFQTTNQIILYNIIPESTNIKSMQVVRVHKCSAYPAYTFDAKKQIPGNNPKATFETNKATVEKVFNSNTRLEVENSEHRPQGYTY